jgi:hypothetical protein
VSRRRILLPAVLLLLPAWAATFAAVDPEGWSPDPNDHRSFKAVSGRYQAALEAGDYPLVLKSLRNDLEGSGAWSRDEPEYQKLLAAMDLVIARFEHFDVDLARDDPATAVDVFLDRYPTGLFQPVNHAWFRDDLRVTYDEVEALPVPKGEDFLYRAGTFGGVLWEFKKPAWLEALRNVRLAAKRWEIRLGQGMSMYPWEAAFNEKAVGAGTIQDPPLRQWILLHPEAGVEITQDDLDDLRAKEVFLIEVFGGIRYWWKDYLKPEKGLGWFGAALAVTLREDMGPGIGVVGHYGPYITLGATWHDRDGDDQWLDDQPLIVMGVDLFRLAQYRAPRYREQLSEARKRLPAFLRD